MCPGTERTWVEKLSRRAALSVEVAGGLSRFRPRPFQGLWPGLGVSLVKALINET